MKNLSDLEKTLKTKFKHPELLQEALTHRSFFNENPRENISHNERLEFLGDAVLELSVTEFLFNKYPDKNEGELTALRAALVNARSLLETAKKFKLQEFLRLSRGESKDSGKGRQYILANAFEALIGAVYLDQGYEEASQFVQEHICSNVQRILEQGLWRDAKSLFQEKAQEIANITPTYNVLSEAGPDHQKHFVIGVYLEDELVAEGKGLSKQEAQTQAAENALKAKAWNE